MHNNPKLHPIKFMWWFTDINVLLQQFTPFGPCHTSTRWAASDTQLSTHLFNLCISLNRSDRFHVWTSEPMSLLYCQSLNLKSAIDIFLLLKTSPVSRSIGANVFKDSYLFKALWDVYFTYIYCSIATHPDRKQLKEQNRFLHICILTTNQISFDAYSLNGWVAHILKLFAMRWQWEMIIRCPVRQKVHSSETPEIIFTSVY